MTIQETDDALSTHHVNSMLEYIKRICEPYINDFMCVYKLCLNEWLIVMKKQIHTMTNEKRKNIWNPTCAKFRANELLVITIININNGISIDCIENTFNGSTITYVTGKRVTATQFDTKLDNICSHGIHYFKSVDVAFYYRKVVPKRYTGFWYRWYDNGRDLCKGKYIDGKKNDMWTTWYNDGKKCEEKYYYNNTKMGTWTNWYSNGQKCSEGKYFENGRHSPHH